MGPTDRNSGSLTGVSFLRSNFSIYFAGSFSCSSLSVHFFLFGLQNISALIYPEVGPHCQKEEQFFFSLITKQKLVQKRVSLTFLEMTRSCSMTLKLALSCARFTNSAFLSFGKCSQVFVCFPPRKNENFASISKQRPEILRKQIQIQNPLTVTDCVWSKSVWTPTKTLSPAWNGTGLETLWRKKSLRNHSRRGNWGVKFSFLQNR